MKRLTSTAIAVIRNRFGIYADAIMALRAAGETVAPLGRTGKFRVGLGASMRECTGDEIIALAAKLDEKQARRERRKRPAVGRPPSADAGTPEASRDGSVRADYSNATPQRLEDGGARCVIPAGRTRRQDGALTPTAKPVPTAGIGDGTLVHDGYDAALEASLIKAIAASESVQVGALSKRVDALEAELATFKATVRATVADLCEHLGLGRGR